MNRRRRAPVSDEPNDTESPKTKRAQKKRPAPKGRGDGGQAETEASVGEAGKDLGAMEARQRTATDGQEEATSHPGGSARSSSQAEGKTSAGWKQQDRAADRGFLTRSQTAAGKFVPIFLKPKRGSSKELQERAAEARSEQERPPQPSILPASEPGTQGSTRSPSQTPELMDLLVTSVEVVDRVVILQYHCPDGGAEVASPGTEGSVAADRQRDLSLVTAIKHNAPGDPQDRASSDLSLTEGKHLVRWSPGALSSSPGGQMLCCSPSVGPPEDVIDPSQAAQGKPSAGTRALREQDREELKPEKVTGSELQPIHAQEKPEVTGEQQETDTGGHPHESGPEGNKCNGDLGRPGTNTQDSLSETALEGPGTAPPIPKLFLVPAQMEAELSRLASVTPFSELSITSPSKAKTEPQGRALPVSNSEVLASGDTAAEDGAGGIGEGKTPAGTSAASFLTTSSIQVTLQQVVAREVSTNEAGPRPEQTAGDLCDLTYGPLGLLGNSGSSLKKDPQVGASGSALPQILMKDVDTVTLHDHEQKHPLREDFKDALQDSKPSPQASKDSKGDIQSHDPNSQVREDFNSALPHSDLRPPATEDFKATLHDREPRPQVREDCKAALPDSEPRPPVTEDFKSALPDSEPRPPVMEDFKSALPDSEPRPPVREDFKAALPDSEPRPPVTKYFKAALPDSEPRPPAREDFKAALPDSEPRPSARDDLLVKKQVVLSQGPSKEPVWGREARSERPPAAVFHAEGSCASACALGKDWPVPSVRPPSPQLKILTQAYKYLPEGHMERIMDELSMEPAEPQMLAEGHSHGRPQGGDVQHTEGLKPALPVMGDPIDWLSDTQLREELKEQDEVLCPPCTPQEQDGTPIVHGLIMELSNLNRLIMNTHRDLESIRRLRYRRGKPGTKYLPHASFMGKRRKEL